MSPDITLAQQFWAWPDPVMKRDAAGRIIFVNAAFLQMYGGTIETWTGNALEGWSAPHPVTPGNYPTPNRFETRIEAVDTQTQEQIFDWLEQTGPDGSALAIARNVTIFGSTDHPQHTTEKDQAVEELSVENPHTETPLHNQPHEAHATQAVEQQNLSQNQAEAQTFEPAPQSHSEAPEQDFTELAHSEYKLESAQSQHVTVGQNAQTLPHDASPITNDAQFDQQTAPSPKDPTYTPPSEDAHAPTPQTQTAAVETPKADVKAPSRLTTEERDFQRRALPMESNNSILGNNWRDAVIAKAVGAEAEIEEKPQSQPDEADVSGVKPMHILLAEDNAINALLTRTLLEAEGHTVETVEDGVLAVEAMKSQTYDLIFMDMRMPNMDGLEATRKIRQLPNVPQDLPIIALTANAFDDDRNACFDSGMNDFMTKPVSAEELSAMVVNWTEKSKTSQNAA